MIVHALDINDGGNTLAKEYQNLRVQYGARFHFLFGMNFFFYVFLGYMKSAGVARRVNGPSVNNRGTLMRMLCAATCLVSVCLSWQFQLRCNAPVVRYEDWHRTAERFSNKQTYIFNGHF